MSGYQRAGQGYQRAGGGYQRANGGYQRGGRGYQRVGYSNPNDISGCLFWIDGKDNDYITESGGLVSRWSDKSGQGNFLEQLTGSKQPTLDLDGLDGRNPSIDFTASSVDYLVADTSLTEQAYTIFYVGTYTSSAGFTAAFTTVNSTEPSGASVQYNGNDQPYGQAYIGANATTVTLTSIPAAQFNSKHILISTCNSSNLTIRGITVDYDESTSGSFAGPINYTNVATSVGAKHSAYGASGALTGGISEVVYFNRVLTADEITKLADYLKHKWDIKGG
jgi:hypothetical protein